jgi:hypothetical protein
MMHGPGKSDSVIVARKPTNKAGQPAAEPVERRAGTEGNASQQSTCRAQNRASVSQALDAYGTSPCKGWRVASVIPCSVAWRQHTQGRSRVPELGSLGSVRGALSNEWPCDLSCSLKCRRNTDLLLTNGLIGVVDHNITGSDGPWPSWVRCPRTQPSVTQQRNQSARAAQWPQWRGRVRLAHPR